MSGEEYERKLREESEQALARGHEALDMLQTAYKAHEYITLGGLDFEPECEWHEEDCPATAVVRFRSSRPMLVCEKAVADIDLYGDVMKVDTL